MGEADRWRCASRDEGCVPLATDVSTPCRSIWRWGSLVGEEGFVSPSRGTDYTTGNLVHGALTSLRLFTKQVMETETGDFC
uniref:Uncharacterized protein n=1 Tax=Oryza nivara TaxID=4536 RepID=A0A0E0GYE5_ORYNI